ncbi:hypothetical protein MMC22_009773 [Lobaria immixta]|nr:hypothetical protein [Lobaria immixta]
MQSKIITAYAKSALASLRSLLPKFTKSRGTLDEEQAMQIEDYRPGYPRFSALIAAQDSFHLCRRFPNLRARLLLLKQDRLSVLEKELDRIDLEETSVLFLQNSRRDLNAERKSVLIEIDAALMDYDALVERNHRILTYEPANPRDVLSLQNWVKGNPYLARDETAYLAHCKELLSVVDPGDGIVGRLEAWIEDKLIQFYKGPRGVAVCSSRGISRDSHVYIFGSWVMRAARTLVAVFIIALLVAPVAICNSLDSVNARLAVIIMSTILMIATLSGLTKARTIEMLVAGATYATVLTVFVSGTISDGKAQS